MKKPKLKVVRVVTAPEAVTFHLRNTLNFIGNDFDTTVIGSHVSQFEKEYPLVKWVDLDIPRKISPLKDFIAIIKLFFVLTRLKPDIVHSIMPKAGFICSISACFARIPVRVHTFTGQVWANRQGVLRFILKSLDQLITSLNTHVFTDSKSQSQFLFENGVKYNGQPIPILGSGSLVGVDLLRFNKSILEIDRQNRRHMHKIKDTDIVFGFTGRKCIDKGIFELIEAFKRLSENNKNVWLLLLGPDESDGMLQREIEKLQVGCRERVINIGFVDFVGLWLSICDIFCLPSYREGFGSVVLEAAALGIPSIGSNISGLTDAIVDEETGVLIPAHSVEALHAAMVRLSTDSNLRKKMGLAAEIRVKSTFDAQTMYQHLADFYIKTSMHANPAFRNR